MSLSAWLRQRRFTREHRSIEQGDGFRLLMLTGDPYPTYMGARPWCDAVLRDCLCGVKSCCLCRHYDKDPRKGGASR